MPSSRGDPDTDWKTIAVSIPAARKPPHTQNPQPTLGTEKCLLNRRPILRPKPPPVSAPLRLPVADRESQTPRSPGSPPSAQFRRAAESVPNEFSIRPAGRTIHFEWQARKPRVLPIHTK